jgi:hypothetical protein
MSGTVSSMIEAAKHEWDVWGKSTWNVHQGTSVIGRRDDSPEMAEYVIRNYCKIAGGSPSLVDIQEDLYAWSAVGLSAIMKQAGFTRDEFPFAQSHSVYLRRFIKARRDGDMMAAFWGFRQGEAGGQPDVGDIVAYARGKNMTAPRAAALFNSNSSYMSHCDLVVAKRDNEIDVIGANVIDSVTLKTLRLDSNGHIKDPARHWFAVLKRQAKNVPLS